MVGTEHRFTHHRVAETSGARSDRARRNRRSARRRKKNEPTRGARRDRRRCARRAERTPLVRYKPRINQILRRFTVLENRAPDAHQGRSRGGLRANPRGEPARRPATNRTEIQRARPVRTARRTNSPSILEKPLKSGLTRIARRQEPRTGGAPRGCGRRVGDGRTVATPLADHQPKPGAVGARAWPCSRIGRGLGPEGMPVSSQAALGAHIKRLRASGPPPCEA